MLLEHFTAVSASELPVLFTRMSRGRFEVDQQLHQSGQPAG